MHGEKTHSSVETDSEDRRTDIKQVADSLPPAPTENLEIAERRADFKLMNPSAQNLGQISLTGKLKQPTLF
jgi:hypothetical protein